MKRFWKSTLGLLLAVLLVTAASSGLVPMEAQAAWDGTAETAFGGGSGTQSNPYVIQTEGQLAYFLERLSAGDTFEGAHIQLAADLDMTGGSWETAGTFAGTLDGMGCVVETPCPLFLTISEAGTVKRLICVATQEVAQSPLVQDNYGLIESCVASGDVNGNYISGLICDYNGNTGVVRNCGGTGSVAAYSAEQDASAGFIGECEGTVENCYAALEISANTTGSDCDSYKDIIYGWSGNHIVPVDCYYDADQYTKSTTQALGYSTSEMQSAAFVDLMNDGSCPGTVWVADSTGINDGYPIPVACHDSVASLAETSEKVYIYHDDSVELAFTVTGEGTIYYTLNGSDPTDPSDQQEYTAGDEPVVEGDAVVRSVVYADGQYGAVTTQRVVQLLGGGTEDDPYCIYTKAQLDAARYDLGASYALMNDLEYVDEDFEAGGIAFGGWVPLGADDAAFTGTFDGNGCAIYSLQGSQGGLVDNNAGTIGQLRLLDHRLSRLFAGGNDYYDHFGPIANSSSGTITRCYTAPDADNVPCTDVMYNGVGGIVGFNSGTVSYCRTTGEIQVDSYASACQPQVAGVAGKNNGTVQSCYSDAEIYMCYTSHDLGSTSGGMSVDGDVYDCRFDGYIELQSYDGYFAIGASARGSQTSGSNRVYDGGAVFNLNVSNGYPTYKEETNLYKATGTTADLDQANFPAFDFDTVWMITPDGPMPQGVMDADGRCLEKVSYDAPDCATGGVLVVQDVLSGEEAELDIPAYGHDFTGWAVAPDAMLESHCRTCLRENCGITETDDHQWEEQEVTPPTCQSEGSVKYGCDVCGHSYTETSGAKTGCTFETYTYNGDATCLADGTETAQCIYSCGSTDVRRAENTQLDHIFDSYTYNNDATCIADGTETAVCALGCNTTDTRDCENTRLEHQFTTYTDDNNATCLADGTETAFCDSGCGESDTRVKADSKTHHSFTNYVPDGNAACVTDGTKTAACDYGCGERDTQPDVGSATGHEEEIIPGYAATCETTGLSEGVKCAVCGEVLQAQTVLDKLPHSETVVAGYAATCTVNGLSDGKKCTVCGETTVEQTVIIAQGHKETNIPAVPATCKTTGLTEGKKCTVCGEITVTQEELPLGDHTEEIIPGYAATCTTMGRTDGKKCSVCDVILQAQQNIPALGHSWQATDNVFVEQCGTCGTTRTNTFNGTCGTGVTWTLTADGVLTISGSGSMNDYTDAQSAPWAAYADAIVSVVVEEGITGLGSNAFACCTALKTLTLPSGVDGGYMDGFTQCTLLETVTVNNHRDAFLFDATRFPANMQVIFLQQSPALDIFAGGEGTATNPYLVATAAQLDAVREYLHAHYRQIADIDMTGVAWVPIGGMSVGNNGQFSGSYDGDGYKITNLTIESDLAAVGMFGDCMGATLKDITLEDLTVTVTDSEAALAFVGGLSGVMCGTVENCTVSGSITATVPMSGYFGGICAEAQSSTITGCTGGMTLTCSAGDNETHSYAGGITGFAQNSTIQNCTNTGAVTIRDNGLGVYAGGIAGHTNGAVTNCKNSGTIDATTPMYAHAGGIAASATGAVSRCANTGVVDGLGGSAGASVGGICGYGKEIQQCVNTGAVSAGTTSEVCAGGIVAHGHGTVKNCFNVGAVTASVEYDEEYALCYSGGIAGYLEGALDCVYSLGQLSATGDCTCYQGSLAAYKTDGASLTDAYYCNCSQLPYAGVGNADGGTACTPAEMKEQSTYAGFDFTDVWSMDPDAAYPYPVLQKLSVTLPEVELGISGICGDNMTWSLDEQGTLTFSGSGEMYDYPYESQPWLDYLDQINKVVVEEGVTSIGAGAFWSASNYQLTGGLTLPSTLETIGDHAFQYCMGLGTVQIPDGVTSIGEWAFQTSGGLTTVTVGNGIRNIGAHAFDIDDEREQVTVSIDAYVSQVAQGDEVFGDSVTVIFKTCADHIWGDAACTEQRTCTVCGAVEEQARGHQEEIVAGYAATCTENGLTDGKKCTVCGETTVAQTVITAEGHKEETVAGTPATCTVDGLTDGKKCTVCGETTVEQKPIIAEGHKEETITGTPATCTVDGLTDGKKCTVCGETTVAQTVITAEGHKEETIAGTPATCTVDGLTDGKKCTVCGETTVAQTVITAEGHKEETIAGTPATCTVDGLTDGKKCTVCGETTVEQKPIIAEGHKEETITGYAATCTVDGLTDGKKCTICGETTVKQETIPMQGHKAETVAGTPATCTSTGLTDGKKCTVCGEVTVKQETIPAQGHKEEVVAGTPASCTVDGLTDGKKCTVCGETTVAQTVITAEGHKEETVAGKPATCTVDGLTDGKKCTVCGETTVAQTVITAEGHKEETVVGKPATCTVDGLTDGKKCTVCGETTVEQKPIIAEGHKEETVAGTPATCTVDGLTDGKKCTVCGEVTVKQETIPAQGHKEETVAGTPATCTVDGLTDGKKCTVCGETTVEQKPIIAEGHKEETVAGKPATCTVDGLTDGKKCTVCGETTVEQKPIIAEGHKEETVAGKPATCTVDGLTDGKKCTVCGETTVTQTVITAEGHKEETVVGKPATCTVDGLTEGKKCTVCGEITVAQTVITAEGHKEETIAGTPATCTVDGLTDGKKCTVCGETTVEQKPIIAEGHKEETVAGTPATCTVDGLTDGKKCTVCGETTVEQKPIIAEGHKEETVAGKPATCTVDGLTEGKKCTVCGETTVAQTVITAEGHKEETVAGTSATCTSTGLTDGKKCTACGEITLAQTVIPVIPHGDADGDGACDSCQTVLQYIVTFDTNGGVPVPGAQKIAPGGLLEEPEEPVRKNHRFGGWVRKSDNQIWDFDTDTVEENMVLEAQWHKDKHHVHGHIHLHGGGRPGHRIKMALKQGNLIIRELETDEEGYYEIDELPAGIYNLIAEDKDGRVTTTMVEIRADGKIKPIEMPEHNVRAELIVPDEEGNDIVVGGLDVIADQHHAEDTSVTVTMKVGKTEDITEEDAPEEDKKAQKEAQKAIKEQAKKQDGQDEEDDRDYVFLDIKIERKEGQRPAEELADTNGLLEIRVPVETHGRRGFKVYRHHGDEIHELCETPNGDGEYIEVHDGYVVIHARYFSMYAVTSLALEEDEHCAHEYYIPVEYLWNSNGCQVILACTAGCGDTGDTQEADAFTVNHNSITMTYIPDELKCVIIAGYNGGQMKAVQVVDHIEGDISFDDAVRVCDDVKVFFLDSAYAPL